ncbi:MAG: DUF3160 domain-containing protein [Oscillospiraceae bacterium]|jgi:hypothetical protein|nr:DUF3160 domain-containing protein [Oscillospiraceae bacterium]
MRNISKRGVSAILAIALLLLSSCADSVTVRQADASASASPSATATPDASPDFNAPTATADPASGFETLAYTGTFADYRDYVYSGTPSIPDYRVESGLANVANFKQFDPNYRDWETSFGYWHSENNLSSEAIAMIERNGFAVSDKYSYSEFFQLYESNRYNYVPNFITTDSAVHTFHLMFDYVLTDLEQNKLYPVLTELTRKMLDASVNQYNELKETEFKSPTLRNIGYFSVAMKLLDSSFTIPAEVKDYVEIELGLIANHQGITVSPVINLTTVEEPDSYKADYSQYIVRSHYNRSPELQAFFKAMMWYGQMTFRSGDTCEVKSALLQTSALQDPEIAKLWATIFEPTNFFVGECDDITYFQYADALKSVYGDSIGITSVVGDMEKFPQAYEIVSRFAPPKINSVPIRRDQDRDAAVTGYRFMGQRFTVDAYVMQNLVDRAVAGRMLPNSLDVPAAFGSDSALKLLEGEATVFPDYSAQMTKTQAEIAAIPQDVWHTNLYWSWMYMLRPFADSANGAGYPLFMQNEAWTLKELNSFQGSWTELKHDTLLYAKAMLAEAGDGDEKPVPPDDRGYVEPNPVVYGRLAALVRQTLDGLKARNLLTSEAEEALNTLLTLSTRLTEIAEKELANSPLSDADYELIRTFGVELEHIWDVAKKYEMDQMTEGDSQTSIVEQIGESWVYDYIRPQFLDQHPLGVVADIATDPSGQALEEGTGYAKTIFVVFLRDGVPTLASGAVYSHYEFTVPLDGRMTDDQWHERMRNGDLPPLASWKSAFTVDIGKMRWDDYN